MNEMPTVAEQLRAAREAKRLTVQQVADATKIRTDHIRALEEGNFDRFPAPIYIRGSVKSYATMLKLDVLRVMTELDAELKGTEKFADPPPLVEAAKSPLDQVIFLLSKVNGKVALIGGGLLIVVLVAVLTERGWRHHGTNEATPNLPPAVYQPSSAGDTLPLPKK